jgi:hypothetical protein
VVEKNTILSKNGQSAGHQVAGLFRQLTSMANQIALPFVYKEKSRDCRKDWDVDIKNHF